jgi:hypothetical protein
MIEILFAASLVTFIKNDSFEVESCTATPFEVVKSEIPKWPNDVYSTYGFTEFLVYVDESGGIINSVITSSEPRRIFDRVSKRALSGWQFNKSKNNERCFNVKFKFQLGE